MKRLSTNGFTIIEMLLVVAVLTIILLVASPLYGSLNNSNQFDAATNILVQDLYQAQTHSRNQFQDSQWGVAVNGQVITLFSGATYASRNTANDVTYTVPSSIALSGSSQVVYSKLYGLPTATGAFGVSGGGRTGTVTVNSKGTVEY
jgi:prepilin-type N-terminal cleavage/methylation domain-containing protein